MRAGKTGCRHDATTLTSPDALCNHPSGRCGPPPSDRLRLWSGRGPAHRRDGGLRRLRGPDRGVPPRAGGGRAPAGLFRADRLRRSDGGDGCLLPCLPHGLVRADRPRAVRPAGGRPRRVPRAAGPRARRGREHREHALDLATPRGRRGAASGLGGRRGPRRLERRRGVLVRGVYDRLLAPRERGPADGAARVRPGVLLSALRRRARAPAALPGARRRRPAPRRYRLRRGRRGAPRGDRGSGGGRLARRRPGPAGHPRRRGRGRGRRSPTRSLVAER